MNQYEFAVGTFFFFQIQRILQMERIFRLQFDVSWLHKISKGGAVLGRVNEACV
jgi:hypothetical protein